MIIPSIDPRNTDGVSDVRRTTYARHTPALKLIVMDIARSSARVFQTPADASQMDRDRITPRDSNTSIRSHRLTYPVISDVGTTVSPTRTGIQEITSRKGPTGSVEVRNAQIFNTSITINSSKNVDPTSTFGRLIIRELFHDSRTDVSLLFLVNFERNAITTERQNFMNLGIPAAHTSDEVGSFSIPVTIESKGQRMDPTGSHLVILLVKLDRLE